MQHSVLIQIFSNGKVCNFEDTKYDTYTNFADQQYELLRSSKTEQEALLQKLQTAEQCYKESEVSMLVIFSKSCLCYIFFILIIGYIILLS